MKTIKKRLTKTSKTTKTRQSKKQYYDIVIVGGGIAGVYTTYNLNKKYPDLKVLLLEKNDRYGGRVYTHHKKIDNTDYVMDLGAGRIGFHHKLMVDLIYELKLDKSIIPITNTKNYIEYNKTTHTATNKSQLKQKYGDLLYKLFNSSKITSLSKTSMQNKYLNQLLPKFFKKNILTFIINSFEYKNKLFNLNAYNAINYFRYDYNTSSKFFVLKTGFSTIIDKMIEHIKKHNKQNNQYNPNYICKKNTHVNNIVYDIDKSNYKVLYKTKNSSTKTIYSTHIVCALPRADLIKLDILNPYSNLLDSINEISKVRIFEIYDTKLQDHVWFKDIPKTITNQPQELQFIIPINPSTGLIMSSYNENLSIRENFWNRLYKKSPQLMKNVLHKSLQTIFNRQIPDSKYLKFYYWKSGVACWKKNIDSNYTSRKILNLLPNFYICGENYSEYQAWCEGALQTSKNVVDLIKCNLQTTQK